MNIIAIIPARGGSKGIPGKNVMNFCGKPLVAWSVIQAKNTSSISDVFVTTDDTEIANISAKYGAHIIERPSELATDYATTEDAILHVLSQLDCEPNIIVYLQPTSPVRQDNDIKCALDYFVNESADSLFSAAILDDFCAWKKDDDQFKSLTYDYENRGRRQEREDYYLENGSIYIFKPSVLKQYNNRLGGKISLYAMPLWQSYEIDDLDGLAICEYYMKYKIINDVGNEFDNFIFTKIQSILQKTIFPDYDDIHTDTFAEIIDKLIIAHIRYWYLEDAMSTCTSAEELLKLRRKAEVVFQEKRPMLIAALDKLISKMVEKKFNPSTENIKMYK